MQVSPLGMLIPHTGNATAGHVLRELQFMAQGSDDGLVRITARNLAIKTGLTESQIQYNLKRLKERFLLHVEYQQYGPHNQVNIPHVLALPVYPRSGGPFYRVRTDGSTMDESEDLYIYNHTLTKLKPFKPGMRVTHMPFSEISKNLDQENVCIDYVSNLVDQVSAIKTKGECEQLLRGFVGVFSATGFAELVELWMGQLHRDLLHHELGLLSAIRHRYKGDLVVAIASRYICSAWSAVAKLNFDPLSTKLIDKVLYKIQDHDAPSIEYLFLHFSGIADAALEYLAKSKTEPSSVKVTLKGVSLDK